MLKQIKAGDLVFDVGACEGNGTQLFLSYGARVICFEPCPSVLGRLIRQIGDDPSVQIEPVALGRQPCVLMQSICNTAVHSTFSRDYIEAHPDLRWHRTHPAYLSTLDMMIERYGLPRVCEIDVCGYEEEVLRGLTRRIPLLAVHTSSSLLTARCIDRLMQLGYRDFNAALQDQDWVEGQQLLASAQKHNQTLGTIYARNS